MSVILIPLSRGMTATVDEADEHLVRSLKWLAIPNRKTPDGTTRWYAAAHPNNERANLYLHRYLLDAKTGDIVDHINGDGLDCRRSNLRLVTPMQNAVNRTVSTRSLTGFKGVTRCRGRFLAYVSTHDRAIRIGSFDSAEDAARAYDRAARERYGPYARVNFPEECSPIDPEDDGWWPPLSGERNEEGEVEP